jgi:hypothetical protein
MMNIMKWIMDRIKEPSTIGVVAAALGLVGFNVDEGMLGEILIGVAAVLGVIAAARKEKGEG